jgi:hypothetical protein
VSNIVWPGSRLGLVWQIPKLGPFGGNGEQKKGLDKVRGGCFCTALHCTALRNAAPVQEEEVKGPVRCAAAANWPLHLFFLHNNFNFNFNKAETAAVAVVKALGAGTSGSTGGGGQGGEAAVPSNEQVLERSRN